MEKHFELTDTEFEAQFKDGELEPSLFSHEAHLRLAWIQISRYGLEKAEENIQVQLQKFVALVGAEDKYHSTLTIAATRAVDYFMRRSKADNFRDFIGEFPQLKHNFKALIASHYGFDVFQSDEAKGRFVEPDLLPFD